VLASPAIYADATFLSFDDKGDIEAPSVGYWSLHYDAAELALNTDSQFIKAGEGSLKVMADEKRDARPGVNGVDFRLIFGHKQEDGSVVLDPQDWSSYTALSFWLNIPPKTFAQLSGAGSYTVQVATQDFSIRWWIPLSELTAGWNHIVCDLQNPTYRKNDASFNIKDVRMLCFHVGLRDGYGAAEIYVDEIKLLQEEVEETEEGISAYIEMLVGKDFLSSSRAADALAEMGEVSIPALEKVLRTHPDMWARRKAVSVLRRIGGAMAVPALMLAIADKESVVAKSAAEAILEMGEEGVDMILESLLTLDYFGREVAIKALQDAGYSREGIASDVAKYVMDSHGGLQVPAIRTLGQIGMEARAVIPQLLQVLENAGGNLDLELELIGALQQIDPDSVPLSAWVLALGPEGGRDLPFSSRSYVNKAMDALECAGLEAVPLLLSALRSADPVVRSRAAVILGNIRPEAQDAVAELVKALNDEKWHIRWEAARALEKIVPDDRDVEAKIQGAALAPVDGLSEDIRSGVTVEDNGSTVTLRNGIVSVEINKQNANIVSLYKSGKRENLLGNGGKLYWDVNWNNLAGSWSPNGPAEYRVVAQSKEFAEISLRYSEIEGVPFDVDIRFALHWDSSGVYVYSIFKKRQGTPDVNVGYISNHLKFSDAVFNYRFINDKLQGEMVKTQEYRKIAETAEKTGGMLINATYRQPDGRIWAKHAYYSDELGGNVYGACGEDTGIWVIHPSLEYVGASRPNLHAHGVHEDPSAPVVLIGLESPYWGRGDVPIHDGWEKVYGPYMIYVNTGENPTEMWVDAKRKAEEEVSKWPYDWVDSPLYLKRDERGMVSGRLMITDGSSPKGAWIIMARPGLEEDLGWLKHAGPYLFWTRASEDGRFELPAVVPGEYTLYAWVEGVLGEFRQADVEVAAGQILDLGELRWTPTRCGQLVWQIGIPDRAAMEFRGGREYRQWDNFLKYRRYFPDDVNFRIGESDPQTDWFYLHPSAVKDESKPVPWKITFDMDKAPEGEAVLTLATASTGGGAQLSVAVNGVEVALLDYPHSDDIGRRAGMYGLYTERRVRFDASLLKEGTNVITLVQTRLGWLTYVMYDCLRLEINSGRDGEL
jgi:rhamnogalacturonan endolyase